MKKLLTYVSLLLLAISCSTNKHISASAIGLVTLQNYSAKNIINLPDSFNYMVITNKQEFDSIFEATKGASTNSLYPSFDGQTVVACIAQPTINEVFTRFEKAEVTGKEINVYCSSNRRSKQFSNVITSVTVAVIPKVLNAKSINFYLNGKKLTNKPLTFSNQPINTLRESNIYNAKPVVLKRMIRRPVVI